MDFDLRDRLLLAFANLGSYGIAAHPGVAGEVSSVRSRCERELRQTFPDGDLSYVFWLEAEERCAGDDMVSGQDGLPLYYHSASEIVHAIASACADVGVEVVVSPRAGELCARTLNCGA